MRERSATAARVGSVRASCRALMLGAFLMPGLAPAFDPTPLWNFNDPIQSEQRFRAALAKSTGDDAFVLQTQIARTYGLRHEFAKARRILHRLDAQLRKAGPEARTR